MHTRRSLVSTRTQLGVKVVVAKPAVRRCRLYSTVGVDLLTPELLATLGAAGTQRQAAALLLFLKLVIN